MNQEPQDSTQPEGSAPLAIALPLDQAEPADLTKYRITFCLDDRERLLQQEDVLKCPKCGREYDSQTLYVACQGKWWYYTLTVAMCFPAAHWWLGPQDAYFDHNLFFGILYHLTLYFSFENGVKELMGCRRPEYLMADSAMITWHFRHSGVEQYAWKDVAEICDHGGNGFPVLRLKGNEYSSHIPGYVLPRKQAERIAFTNALRALRYKANREE